MGMTSRDRDSRPCPVCAFDRAPEGYAHEVGRWLADPHAFFKAFGPEARAFLKSHPSERLRTMTLVTTPDRLVDMRPVCLCLDRLSVPVASWQEAFAQVAARLVVAHPQAFDALQQAGELTWMGCRSTGLPIVRLVETGVLRPEFTSLEEVIYRLQWLFLMCGVRLNEVIVQVDPYTDEAWQIRACELRAKRAAQREFMAGRRAAQKAWAEAHPDSGDGRGR